MWTLAVQANLVPGASMQEKCDRLEQLGYGGIEVSGADLLRRAEELETATMSSPVRLTSACAGFEGWLVDRNPRARNLAVAEICEMLAVGAELGTAGLVSPAAYGIDSRGVLPPHRHAYTLEEDRQLLVESLSQIAESAARTGGTLLLEPLNRYVDRVLNTLEETASVIDELGSPHVRMLPDVFHMNIEEADICRGLEEHAELIGHMHFSDSNRLLPGLGHIDFGAVLETLWQSGYRGNFAIECRIEQDADEGLRQTREYLEDRMPPEARTG